MVGFLLFINNIVVVVMMLFLIFGILKKVDFKINCVLYVFVLFGVVFSVSIGGIGIFIGFVFNVILVF